MDPSSKSRVPSRALGCVFVPFFALGLFFLVMVLREAVASAATYTWQRVPCTILESKVLESSDRTPWFGYVRYASSAGESIRSSRTFGTYRDAVVFTRHWPAGSRASCYLDPGDPVGALLERRGSELVLLLFLPIPLVFVWIGAVGFYSVVFHVKPRWRAARPVSPVAARRVAAGLLGLVGAGLFLAFLLNPVRQAVAARSWRAQECRILRSEVRRYATSKGSDGFSPEIFYSYVVDEQEHRSDTYTFFGYSVNGWAAAQRVANKYRPRSAVTCYVNPADPDEATLQRDPSLGWLVGLLPLGLLAWGVGLWPR